LSIVNGQLSTINWGLNLTTILTKREAWIAAVRPRTLPLAIACISVGAFLAAARAVYRWEIVALCVTTAVFLQILSNLANDYGDAVHGADAAGRVGPLRVVQSGHITPRAMRRAIGLFALLSAVSGLSLVWLSFGAEGLLLVVLFLLLGALAIGAAVTYTAGRKPYGYAGLGDIAVLIFFGWVAVLGTYFLQAHSLDWRLWLPATAMGLLSVGVLNVNNIRDVESDNKAGKRTIPVRLGRKRARVYHVVLLVTAVLLALIYVLIDYYSPWQFLFLVSLPLLLSNVRGVWQGERPGQIAPYLKQMVLVSLLFALTFGLGQIIS
jgi:1,4-dihydroxy-2-naphthoate polyprenyltransferase